LCWYTSDVEGAAMILVVGATGLLGGRVVELLVEGGDQVRGLVRSHSKRPASWGTETEVTVGDLTDSGSLERACEGVDTVVATATAIGRRLAGEKGPTIREVDELGMADLVDAAETAGVTRFVYLSYAGLQESLGTPFERAKLVIEERLRRSRMRTVIVRPDPFQEVHLTPLARFDIANGKVAVFGSGKTPQRWVSVHDVARLVVAVATEQEPPALVEFGGPEALSKVDAVNIAERVTGTHIKVQRMPLWAVRAGMRLLARRNDALASLFGLGVLQDRTLARWDDGPLRRRGIEPLSATEFVERQARALAD
jgi:uncharacterized protein YbjT (DUF2867 family)